MDALFHKQGEGGKEEVRGKRGWHLSSMNRWQGRPKIDSNGNNSKRCKRSLPTFKAWAVHFFFPSESFFFLPTKSWEGGKKRKRRSGSWAIIHRYCSSPLTEVPETGLTVNRRVSWFNSTGQKPPLFFSLFPPFSIHYEKYELNKLLFRFRRE